VPADTVESKEEITARTVMERMETETRDAQDALIHAKVHQEYYANRGREKDELYNVGDKVMLSTYNRRREYVNGSNKEKRVAKFLPRFDGPYRVTRTLPEFSAYTLDMPNQPNVFNTFHASQLKRHHENDSTMFPSRERAKPGPVLTEDGLEEYAIDRIIDERKRGRGTQSCAMGRLRPRGGPLASVTRGG
jgi:hypothetical protein